MVMWPAAILLGNAVRHVFNRRAHECPHKIARTSALSSRQYSVSRCQLRQSSSTVKRKENPFCRSELLSRAGGYSIRASSSTSTSRTEETPSSEELAAILSDEKWYPVYRFEGVRYAALLARAKLGQTVFSVAYLPYSAYNFSQGAVDSTWFYSTATLAFAAPLLLILFSRYLNRLVGVIAMNESNDFIRIGYLSFWGARRNKFLAVEDVLPLSEIGATTRDQVVKLTWYSEFGQYFFLPTKNMEIVDRNRAEILFGDLGSFQEIKKKDS